MQKRGLIIACGCIASPSEGWIARRLPGGCSFGNGCKRNFKFIDEAIGIVPSFLLVIGALPFWMTCGARSGRNRRCVA
jgi:hypothetical protein